MYLKCSQNLCEVPCDGILGTPLCPYMGKSSRIQMSSYPSLGPGIHARSWGILTFSSSLYFFYSMTSILMFLQVSTGECIYTQRGIGRVVLKGKEVVEDVTNLSKNNHKTNRKVERIWLEYDRHRWRVDGIQVFIG